MKEQGNSSDRGPPLWGEQIAARHAARQPTLYGASRSFPEEPAVLPVFLSAAETIGMVAYGRTTTLAGPVPGAPPIFERWNTHVTGARPYERQYPLVHRMRLVLARVRWWQLRKRSRGQPDGCPIRPLRPVDRAGVRWAIRRHGKTAVKTIALLRQDVRRMLAAHSARNEAIAHATQIICAEIAADRLVAWGRPGNWRKRTATGKHERIPSEFFANPHATILTNGWVTCSPEAPAEEWREWTGPDWGDVRFRSKDIHLLHSEHPILYSLTRATIAAMPTLQFDSQKIEEFRRRRIDAFRNRQRAQRAWICFAEIAEWLGRASGDIKPDEERRSLVPGIIDA